MEIKNKDIYSTAIAAEKFYEDKTNKYPVSIGFYLFKNLKVYKDAAMEIEEMKSKIMEEYAESSDDNGYNIPENKRAEVQQKLTELSNLTQDLKIYPLHIKDFGDIKLSGDELEVLINMIEEE